MKMNYRNHKNAEASARFWGKSLDNPDWYSIENKADNETEIMIYDAIGWPFIEVDSFVRDLSAVKSKKITLRINSPGGDVFDGLAIYNALKSHPAHVVAKIEGLAASIASVIPLAADEVQIYPNAMMMIHNSWVLAAGDKEALRDIADVLEKIDGNLLETYYAKTGAGKREIKQMMNDETWMTAKEAKDKGFVDSIIDGQAIRAAFDLSIFAHAPDGIVAEKQGKSLTEREVERALRDAGASRTFAKSVAAGCRTGKEQDNDEVLQTIMNVIEEIKRNGN